MSLCSCVCPGLCVCRRQHFGYLLCCPYYTTLRTIIIIMSTLQSIPLIHSQSSSIHICLSHIIMCALMLYTHTHRHTLAHNISSAITCERVHIFGEKLCYLPDEKPHLYGNPPHNCISECQFGFGNVHLFMDNSAMMLLALLLLLLPDWLSFLSFFCVVVVVVRFVCLFCLYVQYSSEARALLHGTNKML